MKVLTGKFLRIGLATIAGILLSPACVRNTDSEGAKLHSTQSVPRENAPQRRALRKHFASIDLNGDGKFDKKEFMRHFDGEFDEKDADKNGKLDANECGMLKDFDTDKDGYVSRHEFSRGHLQMFDRFDLNQDGEVTWNEFHMAKTSGKD